MSVRVRGVVSEIIRPIDGLPSTARERAGAGPTIVSASSIAELARRPSRPPDHAGENEASVALAQTMAATPDTILQKLAETALSLCRAGSAGLSLLEDEDGRRRFHWRALTGAWADHLGGGTPRDFGPCGTVLDRNAALLFSHPERDFPYFGDVQPLLEDGLLMPFYVDGEAIGTIWVVSHDRARRFDAEDLRVMTNLATFAGAAYQTLLSLKSTIKAKEELEESASAMRLAQEQQALLLREMSHRVKNLFAIASSLVALSARSARSREDMADAVQERLAALTRAHELTRPGLTTGALPDAREATTLHDLVRTIFAPYIDKGTERMVLSGPSPPIGGSAMTSLALVLHELATNATKYGALSLPEGQVRIDCSAEGDDFVLAWAEDGGPPIDGEPGGEGFGGMLTRRIVTGQFGGRLSQEWKRDGLRVRVSIPMERLSA